VGGFRFSDKIMRKQNASGATIFPTYRRRRNS